MIEALSERYRSNKETGKGHDMKGSGAMHKLSSSVVGTCLPSGQAKAFPKVREGGVRGRCGGEEREFWRGEGRSGEGEGVRMDRKTPALLLTPTTTPNQTLNFPLAFHSLPPSSPPLFNRTASRL